MLREWNGQSNKSICDILSQFGVKVSEISLLKYESLTPDSCIWFFYADGVKYSLYAEGYIPSFEHVENAIKDNDTVWGSVFPSVRDKYRLMMVEDRQEDTECSSGMALQYSEYAVMSGFDHVFLARSTAILR